MARCARNAHLLATIADHTFEDLNAVSLVAVFCFVWFKLVLLLSILL